MTIDHERKQSQDKEKSEIQAVLLAIKAELLAVKNLYMESVGHELDKFSGEEYFKYIYRANLNYFIIYENNSSVIGKIDDGELRQQIVITYNYLKGLIETFHLHNELLDELEMKRLNLNSSKQEIRALFRYTRTIELKDFEKLLNEFSIELFKRHKICMLNIESLLQHLDQNYPGKY